WSSDVCSSDLTSMEDYEKIFVLDSNRLPDDKYILSFRYYYQEKKFQNVATNLIIAEKHGSSYEWTHNIPIRKLSGFYRGFAVFECFVDLKKSSQYEFILKGISDSHYRIS